jgi:hypothetical protein
MIHPRRSGKRAVRLAAMAVGLAALAASGPVQAGPGENAEELVREPWFEGLSYQAVSALTPEACPRLLALLGDPAEARAHAHVIEALGILQCDGAFEAISKVAAASGEVDRATYRALRACAPAMGLLAGGDDRALAWLMARSGQPAGPPAWRFRHQSGARLAAAEGERVLTGLALSGRTVARGRLGALAAQPSDQTLRARARDALALHDLVRSRGPAAVLGRGEASR